MTGFRRDGRPCQSVLGGRAACPRQASAVSLHRFLFLQRGERLAENLRRADMRRHDDAIVHPLALAPGCDDACLAKVSEMPGDFGLRGVEDFHEVADADLLLSHEIEQP